ncbi:hypothetical protein LTR87_017073 [Friedmanniomyces endolithicus]|nr:hypothetical protein LTR87_017073 [Friedmanniomyces endolithicus]
MPCAAARKDTRGSSHLRPLHYTHETIHGHGQMVTLTNVVYTTIPLYYERGSIGALRAKSANPATELRKQDFSIVNAPSLNGTASGSLYLDDGVSIEQAETSSIDFSYDASGHSAMTGSFGYEAGVSITCITVLGTNSKVVTEKAINLSLTGPWSVQL